MTDNQNQQPISQETLQPPPNRHTIRTRKKTTIRVRPDLWQEFLADVRKKGLSSCLVLEALIRVWMQGSGAAPGTLTPMKVNLTIPYVVKKHRRSMEVDTTRKKGETNHYRDGVWFFDPELEPGEIVVEQPREWGKNRCAEGFTWVESRQLWWKKAGSG